MSVVSNGTYVITSAVGNRTAYLDTSAFNFFSPNAKAKANSGAQWKIHQQANPNTLFAPGFEDPYLSGWWSLQETKSNLYLSQTLFNLIKGGNNTQLVGKEDSRTWQFTTYTIDGVIFYRIFDSLSSNITQKVVVALDTSGDSDSNLVLTQVTTNNYDGLTPVPSQLWRLDIVY